MKGSGILLRGVGDGVRGGSCLREGVARITRGEEGPQFFPEARIEFADPVEEGSPLGRDSVEYGHEKVLDLL